MVKKASVVDITLVKSFVLEQQINWETNQQKK